MPVSLRKQHDPNKHPRYPKGTIIDGVNVGGKFMPKNGSQAAIGKNKPIRAIAAKLEQKKGIKSKDANRRLMNAVARELKAHREQGGADDQKTLRKVAQKAIAREVKRIAEGKLEAGRNRKGQKLSTKTSQFELEEYPPPPDHSKVFLGRAREREYVRKITEIDKRNYVKAIAYGKELAKGLEPKVKKVREKHQPAIDKAKSELSEIDLKIASYTKNNKKPPKELIKKGDDKLAEVKRLIELQGQEAGKLLEPLRKQLLSMHNLSQTEVNNFSKSLEFSKDNPVEKGLPSGYDKQNLVSDIAELYKLVGGKVSTLKNIECSEDRAFARRDTQVVNIGVYHESDFTQAAVYHEVAHHVEYSDKRVQGLANQFLEARSDGRIAKLKDIDTGNYEDSEIAYIDKFFHPYVGKVYKNRSTEVVSMGLERFANSKRMSYLLEKDPEHFYLMVAIAALKK